ncbi:zinc finger protein 585B-like [Achroia grisella]|uniref:zinc finger protein 585B-like n=1 Tax=Achroia grisella TaxID=688607 RepID=UPI0027D30028|nr:zinc finger protein 585B-like [Achroia grisella]
MTGGHYINILGYVELFLEVGLTCLKMTTSILAQKILSVKLDKAEFEKNKWLRYDNAEKKQEIIKSIKTVIAQQNLDKTCRLCLKPGVTAIFGNTLDIDMANNIKCILGIEVSDRDGKPQHICNLCADVVNNAVELRQTAEITQWRLQQELEMVSETTNEWEPQEIQKHHGGYFIEKSTQISREWICGRCRRIFQNQDEFIEHEKLEVCRKVKCYVCETCGVEVKTVTCLKRHSLIHTGELQYPCARCPYRARTKYALIVHERSHTGDRPVRCPHCPASFPNSSNLASHKRSHFPPAYHCQLCQKGFKFKEGLKNHTASQHSNAKPFICLLCSKPFSTRKMMRRHERKAHNRPKMRSGVVPSYVKQLQEL